MANYQRLILPVLIVMSMVSFGQSEKMEAPENAFDFWIGSWEISYKNAEGKTITGTNSITKILDGKVIQENFEDPSTGFKGTSISVYNPREKVWRQAWADNQGGYFDFIGNLENRNRIFQTHPKKNGEKIIVSRMVFKDIKTDSFVWDWEKSEDGGETWTLQWKLNYERVKK